MKMKILLSLTIMLMLTGCDAPQRTRAPVNYINTPASGALTSPGGNTSGTGAPASGSGIVTTPPAVTQSPGFENCDFVQRNRYYVIDIGFFGLCQSALDETLFRFMPTLSSPSVRVCLIPTYKDASGSSTYIGNPQCTLTQTEQIISGKLYKDRSGFSTYPLNGVIVMKEPLLTEYFSCMNAYVGWPLNVCQNGQNQQYCSYWSPRCPNGARTNASCETEARNYMSTTCNSFKSKYSNAYIDIRTK
jgi:hypothetical protein